MRLILDAVENNGALCAADHITKSSEKTLRTKRKASSNRVLEWTRAVRAVRLPFLYLPRELHRRQSQTPVFAVGRVS
jgi:hypothetical protein